MKAEGEKGRRGEGEKESEEAVARESQEALVYDQNLNPADKIFIGYLILLAGLILIFIERIEKWPLLMALHVAGISFVILLAKFIAPKLGAVGQLIRGWYPVAFITTTYKELEYLIPRLHPRDFDWQLAAIDYRLFGAHPTVWLERWHIPLFTEVFQIIYATYYFYPVILGAVLWRQGWFNKFYFWVFILMVGFYLSYLGYIAVPAIGPRFILAGEQTIPLSGVFVFETIRGTLDRAEGITRDCFPSGHTEITLLVLYYAWKFHRRTFRWMLVPCSAIILSTVYLRYHYVVDVVAGFMAAGLIILIARPFYKWLGGKEFIY